MLFTAIPVGYLILISCILIVAIPVLIVKMFSKHSKRVTTENYLEAEVLSLNERLHWHKQKIWSLENGLFDRVSHQQVPNHEKDIVQNVVIQPEEFINVDETQIEMDLNIVVDIDTEGTETFVQGFNLPKMTQLTLADQPDVSFMDRLNLKSNIIPFPIEVKHEIWDEEEIPMEQMEFTLDVEATELYVWTKGIHFVRLSIKDHYGEDLALCEIQGRAGTTMIQHPKISAMKDGDSFAASILVDSNGKKVVDKLWCDLAEEFSWSAGG
jgi:hypothetical protein